MSWCPICKNEYQEGVLTCSECKVALVDELPNEKTYTILATAKEEPDAERLFRYLEFSKIESKKEYDSESDAYTISVPSDNIKQAKKAFHAFFLVESEKMQKQTKDDVNHDSRVLIAPDPEQDDTAKNEQEFVDSESQDIKIPSEEPKNDAAALRAPAAVYVKKAEQSKEMKSTAITFFVFGFLLLVFGFLNLLKIVTLFSNVIALITIFALAVASFAIGINSVGRAKRAAADAVLEEALTKNLNQWLDANITLSALKEMDDAALGDEANYLRRIEAIKTWINSELGEIEDSYLDDIIEEYYNSHF